ncbi:MAG TPA: hypothetical protein VIW80_09060 [Pyrinomonadaceae bacterium]
MMRSGYLHYALKIALLMLISHSCIEPRAAVARYRLEGVDAAQGSLMEIKERRRAFLIVVRSSVIDADDSGASIVKEALETDARDARRHFYPYNVIARKLNEYMRKHHSMSAVDEVWQADYIIYFNLVQYRRTINGVYPYGELYVILNRGADDAKPARIIWKTKKILWAEDAVKEFLSELKRTRGER